jgi:hypothetical protein
MLLYFATLQTPQLMIYSADQQFLFCTPKCKKYSAKYFGVATTICGAKFLKYVAELWEIWFVFAF